MQTIAASTPCLSTGRPNWSFGGTEPVLGEGKEEGNGNKQRAHLSTQGPNLQVRGGGASLRQQPKTDSSPLLNTVPGASSHSALIQLKTLVSCIF